MSLLARARPEVGLHLAASPALLRRRAVRDRPPVVLGARHELQRGGIDAVAEGGRVGAVLEHVAEVAAAHGAVALHAQHAETVVALLAEERLLDRLPETRP